MVRSVPTPVGISLIMGDTDVPTPSQQYLSEVYNLYISPNFTTSNLQALTTPEQLYPHYRCQEFDPRPVGEPGCPDPEQRDIAGV